MVLDNDVEDTKEEHKMKIDMVIIACNNQVKCLVYVLI